MIETTSSLDLGIAHRLTGVGVAGREQHRQQIAVIAFTGAVLADDLVEDVPQARRGGAKPPIGRYRQRVEHPGRDRPDKRVPRDDR